MARDDFRKGTKEALARRVALRCSNPRCRVVTAGPHSTTSQVVSIGVACHITAASPGGPRYDSSISRAQRTSIDNAIWLCQSCAKLVDANADEYTIRRLNAWKITAEAMAYRELGQSDALACYTSAPNARHTPIPHIHEMPYEDARIRLVRSGWQPMHHHFSHANGPDLQDGNGLYFWEQGYHEIEHASGTGLGYCTFLFQDAYGNRLRVVTVGEVIVEDGATAYVRSWQVLSKAEA